MRDYLTIGSVPYEEDCAQVGSENYLERSRVECRAFLNQIIRAYGDPPEGASVRSKTFSHDFGSYREVVVYFDDDEPASIDYAFGIEADALRKLAKWDSAAIAELGEIS